MKQNKPKATVINGDLNISFKDIDEDKTLITCKLDNGAELDFVDDDLVALVLPDFEQQLNRGSLLGVDIEVIDISLQDNVILFVLDIHGHNVNGRIDCSSLNSKV